MGGRSSGSSGKFKKSCLIVNFRIQNKDWKLGFVKNLKKEMSDKVFVWARIIIHHPYYKSNQKSEFHNWYKNKARYTDSTRIRLGTWNLFFVCEKDRLGTRISNALISKHFCRIKYSKIIPVCKKFQRGLVLVKKMFCSAKKFLSIH